MGTSYNAIGVSYNAIDVPYNGTTVAPPAVRRRSSGGGSSLGAMSVFLPSGFYLELERARTEEERLRLVERVLSEVEEEEDLLLLAASADYWLG